MLSLCFRHAYQKQRKHDESITKVLTSGFPMIADATPHFSTQRQRRGNKFEVTEMSRGLTQAGSKASNSQAAVIYFAHPAVYGRQKRSPRGTPLTSELARLLEQSERREMIALAQDATAVLREADLTHGGQTRACTVRERWMYVCGVSSREYSAPTAATAMPANLLAALVRPLVDLVVVPDAR